MRLSGVSRDGVPALHRLAEWEGGMTPMIIEISYEETKSD